MNQIWNVKDTKLIMTVKLIVKRLKLHKELLPLLSSLVLYAHSFGNILLRITIYSIMNCFASPPCKMVLRSAKCIYGKWHTWFESYRTCINIKVTNKTKTNHDVVYLVRIQKSCHLRLAMHLYFILNAL